LEWEKSNNKLDIIKNVATLTKLVYSNNFGVLNSFRRLTYLLPILPLKLPKFMSYQRKSTIIQIKKANLLAKRNSLLFTGCSNYISNMIKPVAESYTI